MLWIRNRLGRALFVPLILGIIAFGGGAVMADGVVGRVFVGYQGWFGTPNDGTAVGEWRHWARSEPAPGNQSFELWPDTREYPKEALAPTGYAALGNGSPAMLFSSSAPSVIDTHFRWMREYGLDGAALQRFGSELADGRYLETRNDVAANVRRAAEANGRSFYVMYDVSGMRGDWVETLKSDWTDTITGGLRLTDSPVYARQGGKPVVCIWGMGFTDRPGTPRECADLVAWFRARGCYVIGGVPTNWRTGTGDCKPGFAGVFDSLDMVSPWSVGRFNSLAGADDFKRRFLIPDAAYCAGKGIAYQPVVWPGFAWSNWNGGTPNMIPRLKGGFMWRQALNVRSAGIGQAYIAMFDEYDEGTAIAKAATDSSMAPSDQYFQTLGSDGSFVSADFYLRLSGAVTDMVKGKAEAVPKVPIPATMGPLWFRSGWEAADPGLPKGSACAVTDAMAHKGQRSIRVGCEAGKAVTLATIPVDIVVSGDTTLAYRIRSENEGGRGVAVDLLLDDGRWFTDIDALSRVNVSLRGPHGRVGGWSLVRVGVGRILAGVTVKGIAIRYLPVGEGAATDNPVAYIDDLVVSDDPADIEPNLSMADKLRILNKLGADAPDPTGDAPITRREALRLAMSAVGLPGSRTGADGNGQAFTDTAGDFAVLAATARGLRITAGVGGGRFGPDEPATGRAYADFIRRAWQAAFGTATPTETVKGLSEQTEVPAVMAVGCAVETLMSALGFGSMEGLVSPGGALGDEWDLHGLLAYREEKR